MIPSIRAFLLINLLLSVTLITSLAIISNIFLAHKDIQTQLDIQIKQTNERLKLLFSDNNINPHNFSTIQDKLSKEDLQNISSKKTKTDINYINENSRKFLKNHKLDNEIEFRIWDTNKKLVLHTPKSPNIAYQDTPGLFTVWLGKEAWRTYTSHDPNTQLTIMIAEKLSYREKLENQLTRDSILIMLITYPFLGLLIWTIVGRSLDTLKKVAQEVNQREPNFLKPVDLDSVPAEIVPLISELNHLFNRLQDTFDRQKRFTADAAHELRTPLAALNTYTQVALSAKTPEDRKNALLKVLTSVNRGTHVVQQLLTLSRMVPEANIADSIPVNLDKEARGVAAELAPEAIAKQIDIALEVTTEEPIVIKGNSTAIAILIRNLVDNAIRYSPAKSKVIIKMAKTMNKVTLHVIDNGPGIPEDLRERVFERFFRIIGNQTQGSGLGLSIVAQIAKIHHAEIIMSTPKNFPGLEFQVIFPAHPNPTILNN